MDASGSPPDFLLDGFTARERSMINTKGRRAVQALRDEWQGQRAWLYGLSGVMALLAVLLPTGVLHQYLTDAGSLSSLHVLGVLAAGAAFAALHGAGAVYFLMHWHRRARRLDRLHEWLGRTEPA